MNYIKHLTGFFDKVAQDRLLNPTHISLYIALFQFWNCNRFRNPISISRDEVMRISKISSKATYHKCLKALHAHGYIKYEPSYNPFRGSHVYLFNFSNDLKPLPKSDRNSSSNFEPLGKQLSNKPQTTTETGTEQADEQAVVPSTNKTNISNHQNSPKNSNAGEPSEKKINLDLDSETKKSQKEKGSAEKEKENPQDFADSSENEIRRQEVSLSIDEVRAYFLEQNYAEVEAHKFYNYFQSIGWLVGGKTPMTDWQAAARNWMLNAPKYSTSEKPDPIKQFDTSTDKDYAEPL
ncbi:MAG: transcriptional regulator [Bacteroidetes bacterium]|nr:transcriptional regulator [Bacteroidota bacterium]